MNNEFFFYFVIFLSNIIQGITGFAGTILAMPFSIKLVGMDVAVPVLNLLGFLSGVYVFSGNRKSVDKGVLRHVVIVMGISVLIGLFIKNLLSGKPQLLYYILGTIVLVIAVIGLYRVLFKKARMLGDHDDLEDMPKDGVITASLLLEILLVAAGVVHGMFVCGGPLLIGYLTRKLPEKATFRATISTIWIFLNGIILISQIVSGLWTPQLVKTAVISLPFLFSGMFIGGVMYRNMSQRFFVILTYILLLIAGLSLFFK